MIRLGPSARVYAFCAAVDMRKGFEGLLALARTSSEQPLLGDLYLFVGRDRKRAKVLYFDGTGLCLFHKRLETGRFACLWRAPHQTTLPLSLTELQLFLEGCALVGKQPLSPPPLPASALRTPRCLPAC
jgi:transposase